MVALLLVARNRNQTFLFSSPAQQEPCDSSAVASALLYWASMPHQLLRSERVMASALKSFNARSVTQREKVPGVPPEALSTEM